MESFIPLGLTCATYGSKSEDQIGPNHSKKGRFKKRPFVSLFYLATAHRVRFLSDTADNVITVLPFCVPAQKAP